mmetsp:Transcript_23378/g.30337  ORF Transcript_23378/g.30337 Transcript_23378/m.30337 type:complete len:533 (+) Transcript_23378:137-1735(+)
MRRKIASLCEGITRDPEAALKRIPDTESAKESESSMNKLLGLMRDPQISLRSLAIVSGAAVFCDILPNYRLRTRTAIEREQRLGKETFATRKHEEALLVSYQSYIKLLENARCENALSALATRCFGQLWLERPRFNLNERVIQALTESLDASDEQARIEAVTAIRQGVNRDKIGEATLLAVRAVQAIIKRNNRKLKSSATLEAFDTLKVYSVDTEACADRIAAKALDAAQQKLKHRPVRGDSINSTKATPKQRLAAQVSLKETAAAVDKLEWQQSQRRITHEFATLLARVLDMGLNSQKFLRCRSDLTVVALRCLDRISHAVDPDLLADALKMIINAAQDDSQDAVIRIACFTTALKLGPIVDSTATSQIQVDRNATLMDALYGTLLSCTSIAAIKKDSLFENTLRAIHQSFLDSRSSDNRALAFARRAIALAGYAQPDIARVFLALAMALFIRYPAIDIDDCYEALTLSQHFDPDIRRRTKLLFDKKKHLPPDPISLYRQLFIDDCGSHFPVEPPPPDVVFASSQKKRRLS